MTPEKAIENQILNFLIGNRIFAWKVKTVGTFDTKLGIFRKRPSNYLRGVADIIGCLPDGKLLAIEVKSEKGRLSVHQKLFLENVTRQNGLAFFARSVDDVEKALIAAGYMKECKTW